MGHIATNFDEVPDQILPVDPGVYTLLVETAELKPTKDQKGTKIEVVMKVNDEGNPNFGRTVYDHISTKMNVKIKRLWKSCGVVPGAAGVNTEDIIGKVCKGRIANRPYKDDSGTVRETSSIQDYLIEGDAA